MAPLAAYAGTSALGALDIVRMIVRMLELLFVNLFADPLTMGAMIDRLSPLMLLTYPAAYILGYLSAPAQSALPRTSPAGLLTCSGNWTLRPPSLTAMRR